MLKHSSNLWVCRVASDQHHIENWLVMYTLRSSFFFLAIWVGYACNQQEDTYGHIHPYINTSNTLHGWSESKKVTFKQRTNETSKKKLMVHKLRSDGSEWEGSESEHTHTRKKRRARDEMERERWSMSSPMEHWKLINLFNVIRSTWPKVCTVMYPLFCSCYLLFFFGSGCFVAFFLRMRLPPFLCLTLALVTLTGQNMNLYLLYNPIPHLADIEATGSDSLNAVLWMSGACRWWILSKYY